MKKIKYLYLMLIIASFASCKNAIDINQKGRIPSDKAFQSILDLEQGLSSIYGNLDYSSQIQFNSVFTDEVAIGNENGGQGIGNGEYGFRLNANSAISSALWSRYYGNINEINRYIKAATALDSLFIKDSDNEDEIASRQRYERLIGEAYAIRAWCHFELLTYFSEDLTNDDSKGVILLDQIPQAPLPNGLELPRNTTGEVFAFIEEDLVKAFPLVADGFGEGTRTEEDRVIFVGQPFITAMRARMALYRGKYPEAGVYAKQARQGFLLATPELYEAIFTDNTNREVIFKLERTVGDRYDRQGSAGSAFAGGRAGSNFSFSEAKPGGGLYYIMSRSLFGQLLPGDVRKSVLLASTSEVTDGIYVIGKYVRTERTDLMADLKIFRASEMLLIEAEAAVEAGNLDGAATLIKELTDERFSSNKPPKPDFMGSKEEAYKEILRQRQLEFAYEGFRWLDLRRIGPKLPAVINRLVRDPKDCSINGACELEYSDTRFKYLPIPISELNANSKMVQNTGY